MKKMRNIYILICIAFTSAGCSSFSDKFDIAGVIDKTESWFFGEENEEEIQDANKEISNEDTNNTNIEEAFPEIDEIQQERPVFEELDQSFFEEDEVKEEVKTKEDSMIEAKITSEEKKKESKNISLEKQNILAVLKIRENIRLNIVKLLMNSDPLVDSNISLISNKDTNELGDKVAIIQFPNNSIIPDQSAYEVIDQIIEIIDIKKSIKLIGHASRSGSSNIEGKRKNMEISISRAETIKNILINKGYPAKKIFTSGKGDLEPLQNQNYDEAINRRVEIFFIPE